ncbi:lipoprotein-releasing ABC transporter permease subunit [Pseudomonas sp. N040]|uniref:lipoprotein-releasing ABC transporter permease subunit n=1 Tax=Pseudomonas sp. N040 TaxID=2785325 RepID=UPI0018A2DE68|nr:lipoprotein-releasing ABC transporter permease subunit [Pseudomonas sp. N040]MBF7731330.1 lipoprotein-releasing ABC transporter permease subunit [Pseudomonas sp. N040]MBW7014973.1 lipoprotein-releasing ABC transporter permease subunit [Pseudomonas sp. N040]
MFRPLSVFIGMRYTRAKRRSHFISFISLTSMLGLALGVMVMILVLSVMNGFDRELRTRILGMVPHVAVQSFKPIRDWQALAGRLGQHAHVQAVAPFVQSQGMLSHDEQILPVMIDGIDPAEEAKVSVIGNYFRAGSLQSLQPGAFGILLGTLAAERLGVKVGDKVTFIAPDVVVTPAGLFPRMKRFTVVGLFKVGAGELDGGLALVHISDAARLQRWKASDVQGLRFRLDDLFQAPQVAWELSRELQDQDFYSRDWTRSHGNLYRAIGMQKAMIGLLLLLIVAVAAFNIISTLVMVVNDKRADIAILRTLGLTPRQIMATFMVQGTIIGVVGTLAGALLGILAALNVSAAVAWLEGLLGTRFLNEDVYFISYLPSQLLSADLIMVCSAALLLSFLATLYPAWRAARTQPAEALRYE